jgi:hypothetical protein
MKFFSGSATGCFKGSALRTYLTRELFSWFHFCPDSACSWPNWRHLQNTGCRDSGRPWKLLVREPDDFSNGFFRDRSQILYLLENAACLRGRPRHCSGNGRCKSLEIEQSCNSSDKHREKQAIRKRGSALSRPFRMQSLWRWPRNEKKGPWNIKLPTKS